MNILLLRLRVQNWWSGPAPGAAAIACGRFRRRKRVTIPRTPRFMKEQALNQRVFSITFSWYLR